jgi:hypothetical protein
MEISARVPHLLWFTYASYACDRQGLVAEFANACTTSKTKADSYRERDVRIRTVEPHFLIHLACQSSWR